MPLSPSLIWKFAVSCLAGTLATPGMATPAGSGNLALPVAAEQLVTTESSFTPWARRVATDIEARLHVSPPPSPETTKLLLGMRVHLALYFRQDEVALDSAARIRAGVADAGERAHAGLTTRAIVSARYEPKAFEREFTALLKALPRDPGILRALVRAREKIAALDEASLLEPVRKTISPKLVKGEPVTLEVADELVRARHRLVNVLPLRAAMLRAYDIAIAAQN
ncbi:MAG: hypothetical protein V4773_28600 [Verrucomicrobiota bacterium]